METYLIKTKTGKYLAASSKFLGLSPDEQPTILLTSKKEEAYVFPYRSYIQSYLESVARNIGIDSYENLLQIVRDDGTETVEKDVIVNNYKFKKDGYTP